MSVAGWAFPNMNHTAKPHYWEGDTFGEPSLCGKWGYVGAEFQGGLCSRTSTGDCGTCVKKAAKILERALNAAYAEDFVRTAQDKLEAHVLKMEAE